MAVAHDASPAESHASTGSTNEASFDWTHNPVGTPRGYGVFVFSIAATDQATSVKLDPDGANVDVPAVAGAFAADTATEPGCVQLYFLGTGVPTTDPITIRVNRNNNATVMYAVSFCVTADGDVEVTGTVLLQENGTLTPQSVDDGSPGADSVRYAACYYGGNSPAPAGTGSTLMQSIDLGSFGCSAVRETTAGQGARNVGFNQGTADDRAAVHVAVREVAGGGTTPLALSGAITPAGAVVKFADKRLSGAVTPAGAVSRLTSKFLAGATSSAGTLTKQVTKPLAGAIAAEGALANTLVKVLALAGALSPTGVLTRLATKTVAGDVSPAGTVAKSTSKPLTGSVSPAGALTKLASKLLSGTSSPSGALTTAVVKVLALAGSLSPTGALAKLVNKRTEGSVTPSGTTRRLTAKGLTGALSPTGAIRKLTTKLLGGALAPAGVLLHDVLEAGGAVFGFFRSSPRGRTSGGPGSASYTSGPGGRADSQPGSKGFDPGS